LLIIVLFWFAYFNYFRRNFSNHEGKYTWGFEFNF